MTRYHFGGTSDDFLYSEVTAYNRDLLALTTSTVTVTFWSAETGGTHYTDLLDANGNPITSAVVTSGQLPQIQGPDGITQMWADAGGGRVLLNNTDNGATDAGVAALVANPTSATAAALSAAIAAQVSPVQAAANAAIGIAFIF